MDWVKETVYSVIMFIMEQATGEWSNQAWQWFSRFFAAPVAVIDDPTVTLLVRVAVSAALGILPAIIAWRAFSETIARMDGNGSIAPETLVRRAIVTGAAVTGTSLAAWFIGTLADYARQVVAALGINVNLMRDFFFLPLGMPPTTLIVLILLFLVGAIILTIQRVVIAAEFTVLLCVGPLMAVGLMREGSGSTWAIWLREVISLMVTPVIQMLVLLLFLRKYGGGGPIDMGERIASLAFLWVLYNTPRWARQLIYQVGAGSAAVNMVAGAGRMVVMRQLLRATAKV